VSPQPRLRPQSNQRAVSIAPTVTVAAFSGNGGAVCCNVEGSNGASEGWREDVVILREAREV
jgi:hypothetical protein